MVEQKSGGGSLVATASMKAAGVRRKYYKPHKTHKVYNLIGRVASDWAHFEHRLDRIIWALVPTISSIPVCLTAQYIGPHPRFSAIVALLTMRSHSQPILKKYITEINTLQGRCTQGTAEKRNRYIHDAWYYDRALKTVAQFRGMAKSDRQYGIRDREVVELQNTIREIEKFSKEADDLFKRINADVKTLLEIQRPRRTSFPHHPLQDDQAQIHKDDPAPPESFLA